MRINKNEKIVILELILFFVLLKIIYFIFIYNFFILVILEKIVFLDKFNKIIKFNKFFSKSFLYATFVRVIWFGIYLMYFFIY